MTELELAIYLSPGPFRDDNAREFWLSRARIALMLFEPKPSFWSARVIAPIARQLRRAKRPLLGPGPATRPVIRMGKVLLHPLPEGASRPLASVIGAAVAGAIRDCCTQHFPRMSRRDRGTLIGPTKLCNDCVFFEHVAFTCGFCKRGIAPIDEDDLRGWSLSRCTEMRSPGGRCGLRAFSWRRRPHLQEAVRG